MLNRFSIILTLCLLPYLLNAKDVFIQPIEYSCEGQKIVMSCYIGPPTWEDFSNTVPLISIGDSDPYTKSQINSNSIPGLDTSRYSVEELSVEYPRIAARITITSFTYADSDKLFSCYGRYYNGSNTEALISGNAPKQPNVPDKLFLSINAEVVSVDTFCRAEYQVSFFGVLSDMPILYYQLYVNGESDGKISNETEFYIPALVNMYVTPGTTYNIGVAAVSCAGEAPVSANVGTFSIPSYELSSALDFELDYFNSLMINWYFTKVYNINFDIGYNLKVNTAFTNGIVDNILNQTLHFTKVSTETSYSFDLGLSSIGEEVVSLDITVELGIVSQCYDDSFSGNIITVTQTDIKSHVPPLNIPYSVAWIVVVVIAVALAVCSLCNCIAMLGLLYQYSEKKRVKRRNAYINLVPEERSEPLLSRAEVPQSTFPTHGYSVNTGIGDQSGFGSPYHDQPESGTV